ncbi:hypothetical protein ACJX0J_017002, partial [Zea mays]
MRGSLAAMLLLLFYYSKNVSLNGYKEYHTIMTLEVYMMEDQEILLLGEQIMGLLSKTDVDLQNNVQQLQICCLNTMNELALRKQANFFDFCEDIVNLICHTISFTFPLHHVGKSMHHLQIHMKRPCIMLVASIWLNILVPLSCFLELHTNSNALYYIFFVRLFNFSFYLPAEKRLW